MSSVVALEQAALLLLISLPIELNLIIIKKKALLNLFDGFHVNNDLQKKS